MAALVNVMRTIEEFRSADRINRYYDFDSAQYETLFKNSEHPYILADNAFVLGYAQGVKATKAEMKRKAKAVKK